MICPRCHAVLPDGERFCRSCGCSFVPPAQPVPPIQMAPPAPPQPVYAQPASFGFCRSCGAPMNNPSVCMTCGVPAGVGQNFCAACGSAVAPGAVVCVRCGCAVHSPVMHANPAEVDASFRKLSDYEKTSGIIWLIIGIIQICTMIGVLCGAWNIYVAITRMKSSKELLSHPSDVVERYENSLGSTIVIMVLNLFFGAVIGIAGALFDLYVRNYVMSNRQKFGV